MVSIHGAEPRKSGPDDFPDCQCDELVQKQTRIEILRLSRTRGAPGLNSQQPSIVDCVLMISLNGVVTSKFNFGQLEHLSDSGSPTIKALTNGTPAYGHITRPQNSCLQRWFQVKPKSFAVDLSWLTRAPGVLPMGLWQDRVWSFTLRPPLRVTPANGQVFPRRQGLRRQREGFAST